MGYVLGSVALDIMANLALEKSDGFARKGWGAAAVLLIMAAFALLSLAVTGMDLFIAYAVWGVLSILGTAIAVWLVFGHRLNLTSWAGVGILILAILLIRLG
ncbi:SMR family multidrug efflux pump [Nitratireductor pacificus pht-3B]|uniref:Spermidine export protein MdtI n=2 Tax=Nitratireductor TaxID=245876 RepID=K2MGB0_9HYPH|nr:SMR family multidrug efflux pump [Nitratireductor pacificus pht-3B]